MDVGRRIEGKGADDADEVQRGRGERGKPPCERYACELGRDEGLKGGGSVWSPPAQEEEEEEKGQGPRRGGGGGERRGEKGRGERREK